MGGAKSTGFPTQNPKTCKNKTRKASKNKTFLPVYASYQKTEFCVDSPGLAEETLHPDALSLVSAAVAEEFEAGVCLALGIP